MRIKRKPRQIIRSERISKKPNASGFLRFRWHMKTFTYKINGKNGMHARPAGALVNAAKGFSSDIKIRKGDRDADAKRLFSVMSLGAREGDELDFIINGGDEEAAAGAIIAALDRAFAGEIG